jgi:hypothetical protein
MKLPFQPTPLGAPRHQLAGWRSSAPKQPVPFQPPLHLSRLFPANYKEINPAFALFLLLHLFPKPS